MTPTTITISGAGAELCDRLKAGLGSMELIDLFGMKLAAVKFSSHSLEGEARGTMIAQEVVIAQPAPWSGEGLPPVGTECEIAASTEYLKISYPEGTKVKIYAHFKHDCGREFAAFVDSNCQVYGIGMAKVFRPIKTPAQIAADEREAAIDELTAGFSNDTLRSWAARAYDDLGYRKGDAK